MQFSHPKKIVTKQLILFPWKQNTYVNNHFSSIFSAVKDAGFNPVLEYAGDDATYQSDPGKPVTSNLTSASESEIQPLWTAQVRASLTQVYEKCSVTIPSLLHRPAHLRPLLPDISVAATAAAAATSSETKNSADSVTTQNSNITAASDSQS